MTSKQTKTQEKKQGGKKRQIKKEMEDIERGRIKRQGRSGGEENERQMTNNVMREIRVCVGYLVWLTCSCVSLPGNGARNSSCYLLSTALDFPEEEMMMQQSSVSISLRF